MKYDHLLNLPRFEPKNHARMGMRERAAQFAPFAALTGYDDAVRETARYVESEDELSENQREEINEKLHILMSAPQKAAIFTCFRKDDRKEGGKLCRVSGRVEKIRTFERVVILDDGNVLDIDAIHAIEIE